MYSVHTRSEVPLVFFFHKALLKSLHVHDLYVINDTSLFSCTLDVLTHKEICRVVYNYTHINNGRKT